MASMNNNLSGGVAFIISATSWLSRKIITRLYFSFQKIPANKEINTIRISGRDGYTDSCGKRTGCRSGGSS